MEKKEKGEETKEGILNLIYIKVYLFVFFYKIIFIFYWLKNKIFLDNFDEILKNIDDELDLGGAEFLDEAITDNKGKKEQNVKKNPNLVTIGMVGYPNVGKSSVINALCNKKLVGVGNMPGKTKAF